MGAPRAAAGGGDLRRDGRLRPQARAVPRDGRRRQEGGVRERRYRSAVDVVFGLDRSIGLGVRDARASRRSRAAAAARLHRGRPLRRARRRRASTCSGTGASLARGPQAARLQRVLDAPALFSVAYGEIASSIYFALGIIALHALGFTPLVLLAAGLLFLIVSLSYAEGTAAIRETGGAATFVRRRVQRPRRLPHRLGALPRLPDRDRAVGAVRCRTTSAAALGIDSIGTTLGRDRRGCVVIAGVAGIRLLRRHAALHARPRRRRSLDLVHAGRARRARLRDPLLAAARSRAGTSLGDHADLALARVRAAARDARVHRPRDRREPRGGGAAARARPAPQRCSARSASWSSLYVAIAVVGALGLPRGHGTRARQQLAARAARRHRPADRRARPGSARRRRCACSSASPAR